MVEVAYSVDPELRRRGYATAMLRAALSWAAAVPEVAVVRASGTMTLRSSRLVTP